MTGSVVHRYGSFIQKDVSKIDPLPHLFQRGWGFIHDCSVQIWIFHAIPRKNGCLNSNPQPPWIGVGYMIFWYRSGHFMQFLAKVCFDAPILPSQQHPMGKSLRHGCFVQIWTFYLLPGKRHCCFENDTHLRGWGPLLNIYLHSWLFHTIPSKNFFGT